MSPRVKRHYKTLSLHFGKKSWVFVVKLSILLVFAIVGLGILWYAGHPEYKAFFGAVGLAKLSELIGEALEEAIGDNV